MGDWSEMVLVGVVARCHGLRGHLLVNSHTDFAEERFSPGAALWTRQANATERLIVESARVHNGRPVISFEGIASIDDAERLLGCELRIPESELRPLARNVYYRHRLVGCRVETTTGEEVGRVSDVTEAAGGSLLTVTGTRGEVLVPLAVDICVRIDVEAARIVIAPPDGLLTLNPPSATARRAGDSQSARGGARAAMSMRTAPAPWHHRTARGERPSSAAAPQARRAPRPPKKQGTRAK
jgi:16S rRNA processing protein RimM